MVCPCSCGLSPHHREKEGGEDKLRRLSPGRPFLPQVGDGDCLTGGRRRVVDWVLRSSWGSLAVTPVIPGQPAGEGPGLPHSTAATSVGSSPATRAAPGKGSPSSGPLVCTCWGLLATDRGAPAS